MMFLEQVMRERARLKSMRRMAEGLLHEQPDNEVFKQTLLKIEVELLYLKLQVNARY